MQKKDHWVQIYTNKPVDEVSWFQEHAGRSIRLIQARDVDARPRALAGPGRIAIEARGSRSVTSGSSQNERGMVG